jgi:CheY-like chemotaxis protein
LPAIHADQGAVEQMLMNLVTNARDAMPNGGVLRIEVRRAHLDNAHCSTYGWGVPGEYVCLSVSDSGTGMDEHTRERVFEPFFTTKEMGRGTGLGMSIVYGLIKQHRGFVHVSSKVGEGTVVKLYFPLATAEAAAESPAEEGAEKLRGGTETILVVDDEAPIRHTAKRVLERHGYEVLLAENGDEALRTFQAQKPRIALVITDVMMPKMSGPELHAAVEREARGVKFLFTSGYTARDVRVSAALDSTVPFLPKPWTVRDLVARVREVLDRD